MGDCGRARVLARHSIDFEAEKLAACFRETIGSRDVAHAQA